jgi:membrane protein implicated in regulation of membrane protease activity
MNPETSEAILGGFGLLAVGTLAFCAGAGLLDAEIGPWVAIGVAWIGAVFYAITHRTRRARNDTGA